MWDGGAAATMLALLVDHDAPQFNVPAIGVSAIVALLAFVFAGLAWRAAQKRGTRGLRIVAAAFIVFALKGIFTAVNVETHIVPHDEIEFFLSVFDLVLLAILFVPFLPWRRAGG
jgi:hypothetical protein